MGVRATTGLCVLLGAAGCTSGPSRPPPGDPLDLVSAEQLYQLGLQLEESGDSIRAEQYFSAAIERGHPEEAVMPALLRVCVRSSRFGDALDYAEPYLSRHVEDWALRTLVASIYMALDQPTEAHAHLELVLELAPEQPSPHYLVAVLYRDRLHDPEAARSHFARYLELDPEGEHAGEARLELRRGADPPAPVPVRLPPEGSDEVAPPPAGEPSEARAPDPT